MKRLKIALFGMMAVAGTATVVAAQTDVLGGFADTVSAIADRLSADVGRSADPGDGAGLRSADDFRWEGTLPEGASLEIKGINGSITAVRARGSTIVLTAETRGNRSDPSTVWVEGVEHRRGMTFCAVYPTPRGERENECAAGDDGTMNTHDNDVRVDFRIEVPDDIDLVARTVNGDVEALDLEGGVHAVTVNGDIDVATLGFAEASTVNGSIDASMGSTVPREGGDFSTVNGSITLDLPDDVDADLDAKWLNGGFDTDLPFSVQGRMTRRSARGVLGEGGPLLSLNTVNGSIRIR